MDKQLLKHNLILELNRTYLLEMSIIIKHLPVLLMLSRRNHLLLIVLLIISSLRLLRSIRYLLLLIISSLLRRSLIIMLLRQIETKLLSMIILSSPNSLSILNSIRLLEKTLLKFLNKSGQTKLAPSLNQLFLR